MRYIFECQESNVSWDVHFPCWGDRHWTRLRRASEEEIATNKFSHRRSKWLEWFLAESSAFIVSMRSSLNGFMLLSLYITSTITSTAIPITKISKMNIKRILILYFLRSIMVLFWFSGTLGICSSPWIQSISVYHRRGCFRLLMKQKQQRNNKVTARWVSQWAEMLQQNIGMKRLDHLWKHWFILQNENVGSRNH